MASDSNSSFLSTGGWLGTTDHKRIGLLYLSVVTAALLVGGAMAVLVRLEQMKPGQQFVSADAFSTVFALHGVLLVLLFLVLAIPAVLGNFCLPLMIGARGMAFPRLNLAGFYLCIIGTVMTVLAVKGSGATPFDAPFSIVQADTNTFALTLALLVLACSAACTGINIVVTVHKMRAPGMTWFKLPLFVWGVYAAALAQLLITPFLAATVVLVFLERQFGIPIFDPAMRGDPVLFKQLIWAYLHPAAYLAILPAMAITSDLIAVHARRRVFGYIVIAAATLSIAILTLMTWGQHLFVSGQSEFASMVFSFMALVIFAPIATVILNWLTTLYKGQITLSAAMLYAIGFLITFTIGTVAGIFTGSLSVGAYLQNTTFAVAHFTYFVGGSALLAFLGGLYHWWPKIIGRMADEKLARIGFWMVFIGLNVMAFSQLILGAKGMPAGLYDYSGLANEALLSQLQTVSAIGAIVLALGILTAALNFFQSLKGDEAPANPWGALSMEWTTSSPPPVDNFAEPPVCTHGPYDYDTVLPEK
jgi:cytochrome c oxidase subunit 1